jgi:uncharacterized DUF497 family protein
MRDEPDEIEWDDRKAASNLAKHGISFEEAATALADPRSITIRDVLHPDRFVLLGYSRSRRLLVVVHAERGTAIRIISAREATRRERRDYEEGL